jgi:hypothetical protein
MESWDPDQPYGLVLKGCCMWGPRDTMYYVLVSSFPTVCTSIRIVGTLSDMSDARLVSVTSK